ncbi:response regulator transcription factor [Janibacter terrae]|uniref:response regulator transcription factor n=1 Tax=Janibacter terrae TaxID=103817 RepID=UPI00082FE0F0|nr:response regulator transcription factor [Janibacter terrae]
MTSPGEGTTAGHVVLVVDDHPVVRNGLTALLAGLPWVARTVEAESVVSALDVAGQHAPSLAVVDLGLPDGDGIDLTRRLRALLPDVRVLVLTMTSSGDSARAALGAGASGYVLKETAPDVLLGALRTVADGGLVLGPDVGSGELLGEGTKGGVPAPFARLSPRELQLVRLVAAGRSNAEIARRMSLADKTVRNQVSSVLSRTGAADRLQLALLARETGLVD